MYNTNLFTTNEFRLHIAGILSLFKIKYTALSPLHGPTHANIECRNETGNEKLKCRRNASGRGLENSRIGGRLKGN